ncbi:MAG: HEAT repeat domain-containing protein, partial [Gemmataceae bacterium]|nr:HEAT repeat domain-containing protein [Gemmataceae bacterium]
MRGALLVVLACGTVLAQPAKKGREPRIGGKTVEGWTKELAKDATALAAVNALMKFGPEARAAAPALAKRLGDDGLVKVFVPIALSRIGPDAVPALKKALEDKSPAARAGAATALGLIGAPARDAGAALIKLLDDKEAAVRRNAATALGQMGHERARDTLKKLLDDKDAAVAVEAAWALIQAGDLSGVEVLAKACENEELAARAIATLAALGPKAKDKAGPALARAAKHKSPEVRYPAAAALFVVTRTDDGLAVVEAGLKVAEERKQAVAALGQFTGSTGAVKVLAESLAHADAGVRRESAAALTAHLGGIAPARKALEAGLLDADAATRWWCAAALLANPGDVRKIEDDLLAAFRLGPAPDKAMRAVLDVNGYERLGQALARILETRRGRFVVEAALAAGQAGAEARAARPALLKVLREGDK